MRRTRTVRIRPGVPSRSLAMTETFGQALHRWRSRRRLSLRVLARAVPCSHGHPWDIEQGSRQVTPTVAAKLDAALQAGGALIAIARRSRTVDPRTGEPAATVGLLAAGPPPALRGA